MGNALNGECGCGERVRRSDGKAFVGEEPAATRTCLPHVDPLPPHRLAAIRAGGVFYEADVMDKMLPRPKQRPLNCGWPIRLPEAVAEWDEYCVPLKASLDVEAQVLEAVREKLGAEPEQFLYGKKAKARWASFEEASKLFFQDPTLPKQKQRGFPLPALAKAWMDDVEFARLRLTGALPGSLKQLRRVDHLPPSFNVSDADLVGRLGTFSTLKEACASGRVFVTDYSQVLKPVVSFGYRPSWAPPQGVENSDGEEEPSEPPTSDVLCNPIALFFMESNGQLMPVGIKLYNDIPEGQLIVNPLYTPDDNVWAWVMAKMYFQQAEMHYHLIGALAVRTVLIAAVVHCMVNKAFSVHHPIKQLLHPHTRGVLPFAERFFNTFLCSSLVQQTLCLTRRAVQKLAVSSYQLFDFCNAAFKYEWQERMDKESDLPTDYYRDDGLQWWNAVEAYVKSVVNRYYAKADDVEEDTELREWVRDMGTRLQNRKYLHPSRPWDPIIFNLTSVIYLCSAQYAARTNGIYETYACFWFCPGRPCGTPLLEMPKDAITEQHILELLPTKRESLLQIGLAYVLNGLNELKTDCIHDFTGDRGFVDKGSNKYSDKLKEDLTAIAQTIDERNVALEKPFEHLHPSVVKPNFGAF